MIAATEPFQDKQFPCGQCGAKLSFAPGTESLKCPYCGAENAIPKSEKVVEELDYLTYLQKVAGDKETQQAQRIQCKQCAAETTMPPNATAGLCPFCGANMVFSARSTNLIKPEGLLPFKVKQSDALEDFRQWIRSLWFAPGDLKQYAQSDGKLVGVYIPSWTYDSDTVTSYTGERGVYYYTTESYTTTENGRTVTRTREVRHTRWSPASGVVSNSFDDILVVASRSLPKEYAERLEPWDVKNVVPYADEYLSGFRAESYQVTLEQGFEEAKQVMAAEILNAVRQDIGGNEQRVHSIDTHYPKITFRHLLLPVWLSAYRFHGKIFRILINARTGEVQGERPYSALKIAAAVFAGFLLILIILILSNANGN